MTESPLIVHLKVHKEEELPKEKFRQEPIGISLGKETGKPIYLRIFKSQLLVIERT